MDVWFREKMEGVIGPGNELNEDQCTLSGKNLSQNIELKYLDSRKVDGYHLWEAHEWNR